MTQAVLLDINIVLSMILELEFMNLQFVTAATTDAKLHFDDIASLDGPAKLMVSQVGIDIFGFMSRYAPVIDGID